MMSLLAALAASSAVTLHPTHSTTLLQTNEQAPATERTELGNGLYMISGNGGNIMFSTGTDGTFVVDSQYANVAEANLELIRDIADSPIVFVLNTHFHGDHTGGNEAFYDAGATIIAHENVRKRLTAAEGDRAVAEKALPVITFSENTTFHWNGQDIQVMYGANAHTDGDAFVYIPDANVIHTGDIMFSGRYPFIDLSSGGTVDGAIASLTRIHDLADEKTKIVPGHGPLSSRNDVMTTINMLKDARALVRAEMMKGTSREDVVSAELLAAYDEEWSWRFINGERMTGTLFDDLVATDSDALAAVKAGKPANPEAQPAEETSSTSTTSSKATVSPEAIETKLEAVQKETAKEVEKARSRASDVIDELTSGKSPESKENVT